jgi:hypothetical protein
MTANIAEQLPLRPRLPEVYGCKDYREQRDLFLRIDEILKQANADRRFLELSLREYDLWHEQSAENRQGSESKWQPPYCPYNGEGGIKNSWILHTRCALRVNIARVLTGSSLRGMSVKLADSAIIRWFCGVNEFGLVKAPAKSTVDRYEDWVDAPALEVLIKELIQMAGGLITDEPNPLGLENPIDLDEGWLDGTCLKANIHYPVDWILLRDVARTLMKATILVRKQGLKNRMPQSPEEFLRDMNKLVIKMTQSRRQKNGRRQRKAVLREMIKLEKRIARHASAHREVLLERWSETDLSQAQAMQIVRRIDSVLEQLPAAIKQARDRILGERRVASKNKVLSIYDSNVNVIVRGKADAEVEFGNVLRIVEQRQGLIIDWELYRDAVADNAADPFAECADRLVETTGGKLEKLWSDRGMDSAKNVLKLESKGIFNGLLPKSPATLKEKMADKDYAAGQRRRASTEGRIGLFKNDFLKNPQRNKGYWSRRRAVAWGVLAHDLWVLARLPQAEATEKANEPARSAA